MRPSTEATRHGQRASIAGGGTDLLQLMRERIVNPDVLDQPEDRAVAQDDRRHGAWRHDRRPGDDVAPSRRTRRCGDDTPVLAEAAESVATPQIRNVGTIAGNVCQRPWCWYYRNGFTCFKNGGNVCYLSRR